MMEGARIVQANLNRSWGALDLLKQFMAEADIGLAIISEPPSRVDESSTYFKSTDDLAAILWRSESSGMLSCRAIVRGLGFVVVHMGDVCVISCYVSPNVSSEVFSRILEKLSATISEHSALLLVGGDFNAHSVFWGSSSTDKRGELMERWSAMFDLRLLNDGISYTCIRPQGNSIVDLSWVSSGLIDRVVGWSVLEYIETLSDHLYVVFTLKQSLTSKRVHVHNYKRWNFKMEDELFSETLELLTGAVLPDNLNDDPEKYVEWIQSIMRSACNTSAPLVKAKNKRRQMYWWSREISDLRSSSIRARRLWQRSKRGADLEDILAKRRNYRSAKKALRSAIRKAKSTSWAELISSIEIDPWGLLYKLVMRKLRKSSPTLSETLGEESH